MIVSLLSFPQVSKFEIFEFLKNLKYKCFYVKQSTLFDFKDNSKKVLFNFQINYLNKLEELYSFYLNNKDDIIFTNICYENIFIYLNYFMNGKEKIFDEKQKEILIDKFSKIKKQFDLVTRKYIFIESLFKNDLNEYEKNINLLITKYILIKLKPNIIGLASLVTDNKVDSIVKLPIGKIVKEINKII
jgi:hypothetical protein